MDVESLAKELILKNMTPEQQMAVLDSVRQSVAQAKEVQKKKIGENVDLVVQALKKIESDIRDRFDAVGNTIEKRVSSIKDGRDGANGKDGRDGKDGKSGRDGLKGDRGVDGQAGRDGVDGVDGVSVINANIDFDGSLIISLSDGREINVGEVVSADVAEKIKIISTMSTNGAVAILDEGTSITSGVKKINFVGATVTATNSGDDVTVNVSAGTGTVTSVAALTLGTTGTDLSSTVANGTTTPVITLNVPTASATNRGVLSSTDWTTFNNKGSGTVTSVSGTAGRITSTGGTTPVLDLASGVAIAGTTGSASLIPVVTIDTYGRVTSITTAANPQGTVTSVTGTAPVVSSGGATPAISMAAATTSVSGYLTSTDWTTFNNKGSGTVTSVAATVPSFLSVSGSPITTTGTLAITLSGTALPIANGGTGATTLAGASIATYTGTETLTNKRIDPRVASAASASSLTPSIATADVYAYTALAAGLTINAPTGTPLDGDKLIFRLLDNGTSQTLTWNATYTVIGTTLPTATTISKTTYVGCIYNANNTRWDVIAVTTQA